MPPGQGKPDKDYCIHNRMNRRMICITGQPVFLKIKTMSITHTKKPGIAKKSHICLLNAY